MPSSTWVDRGESEEIKGKKHKEDIDDELVIPIVFLPPVSSYIFLSVLLDENEMFSGPWSCVYTTLKRIIASHLLS